MSIHIYKGTRGLLSLRTLLGEVAYEKRNLGERPEKILIKSGTGIFATTLGSANYNGYRYEVSVRGKSSLLSIPMKEKTYSVSTSHIQNNAYEAEIIIDCFGSSIGICRDGEIIDNKGRVVGSYSITSNDLSSDEQAELAAIGAGFLLTTELKTRNRFL